MTEGYPFISANITAAKDTQVKTGPGILHVIVVGATAAGQIDIYDGVSGSTSVIGALKSSIAEGTYTFDVQFSKGLNIHTGAASNITVSYS